VDRQVGCLGEVPAGIGDDSDATGADYTVLAIDGAAGAGRVSINPNVICHMDAAGIGVGIAAGGATGGNGVGWAGASGAGSTASA